MVSIPFLHSESLRPLGRDLGVVLIAYCQSRFLRRRCLNGLFGRTHRVSHNHLAGNFAEGKILNPCIDSLVSIPNEGEGLVSAVPEKLLQQMQCLHGERFDIKVS